MSKYKFDPTDYGLSPRPGAHIWKAWADGKGVQVKVDRPHGKPLWLNVDPRNWDMCGPDDEPENWRIKPLMKHKSCKFGVLVDFQGNTYFDLATDETQAKYVEEKSEFYKWLTDWIDFEVEVEDARY
jgi:hypothetical protein